jgi:hypothetical protein
MTMTVEIPTKLVPLLNERARIEHKDPQVIVKSFSREAAPLRGCVFAPFAPLREAFCLNL